MKTRNGFLIASFAFAGALAQAPDPAEPEANQAGSVQLRPVTENGIRFLCGGIGTDEAAQMKREAANYNLMLTFAENSGAYVADVQVEIADAHGKPILNTVCDAPIMLVDLPKADSYRITAEVAGHPVSRAVRIRPGRKGASVGMTWPSRLGALGLDSRGSPIK